MSSVRWGWPASQESDFSYNLCAPYFAVIEFSQNALHCDTLVIEELMVISSMKIERTVTNNYKQLLKRRLSI